MDLVMDGILTHGAKTLFQVHYTNNTSTNIQILPATDETYERELGSKIATSERYGNLR